MAEKEHKYNRLELLFFKFYRGFILNQLLTCFLLDL